MDNIYYPAESITPGDIIRAYNTNTQNFVDALVTDASMSLTEGKYVDLELMTYAQFQNYEQQINDLENYLQRSGSSGSTLTPLKLDPCKKIFFGVDQPVKTDNGFVDAQDLEVGDILTVCDNEQTNIGNLVVSSVEIKRRVIPVYNIILNNMPPEEKTQDDPTETDGESSQDPDYVKYKRLRNYLSYIGVDYDDSVHCYIADDVVVGDTLAGMYSDGSNSGSSTCFLAGTKVMMASSGSKEDGDVQLNSYYKNIEYVKAGDIVSSYDTENNMLVSARVTSVSKHTSDEYLQITLSNGKPVGDLMYFSIFDYPVHPYEREETDSHTFKTTSNHPIYICTKQKDMLSESFIIKAAEYLVVGDNLFLNNGQSAAITSIKTVQESVQTYNIRVETNHNYFADDVLVNDKHNSQEPDKESEKRDDLDDGVHTQIQITASDNKEESKTNSNTICFGYYSETVNKKSGKSSVRFKSVLLDIIKRLVEKFPNLQKIPFIKRILEKNSDDDPIEEDPVEEDPIEEDPVEEDPIEEDPVEGNPVEERVIIRPIQRPVLTGLQSILLSIIEENNEELDKQIHYIWDFGDGSYKYGINVSHNYNITGPLNNLDDEIKFSDKYDSSEDVEIITTYLVTLMIVDNYGNIIDMDMSSITIGSNWIPSQTGYLLESYSFNF